MTDERPCVCSDACRGVRGGAGCTSERTPERRMHGGYRPMYLAARAPVAVREPGRPAARIVHAERGDSGRDYGDEHVERDAHGPPR